MTERKGLKVNELGLSAHALNNSSISLQNRNQINVLKRAYKSQVQLHLRYTNAESNEIARSLAVEKAASTYFIYMNLIGVSFNRIRNSDRINLRIDVEKLVEKYPYFGARAIRYQLYLDRFRIRSMLNIEGSDRHDYAILTPANITAQSLIDFADNDYSGFINYVKIHSIETMYMDPNENFEVVIMNSSYDKVKKPNKKMMYSVKLKANAVKLDGLAEADDWNKDIGKCFLNYLAAKLEIPIYDIKSKLTEMKIDYEDGVSYENVIRYFKESNRSFISLAPDYSILDKYSSATNHNKVDLIFLVNNDHIYPLENESLQNACKRKKVGEFVLNYDKELIDFNKDNVIIVKDTNVESVILGNMAKVPSMNYFEGHKVTICRMDNKIYVACPDYDVVMNNCIRFGIQFEAQNLAKLCYDICDKAFDIPMFSTYNNEMKNQLCFNFLRPINKYMTDGILENDILMQIDTCRFYTSILYNRTENWCVMDLFDTMIDSEPAEIKEGFYCFENDVVMNDFITIPAMTLIDHSLCRYVLENGYATKPMIKSYIWCSRFVEPTYFKQMVEHFYVNHPDCNILKQLFNMLIGMFAKIESRSTRGFLTTSLDVAEEFIKERGGLVEPMGEIYKVFIDKDTILRKSHRPIWMNVISESYIRMDQMIKNIVIGHKYKLHAIKTDCLVISETSETKRMEFKEKPIAELGNIGSCYLEKKVLGSDFCVKSPGLAILDLFKTEQIEHDDSEIENLLINNNGFCLNGRAGTGKSWIVLNRIIPKLKELNKTFVVLTLTHMCKSIYKGVNSMVLASYIQPNVKPMRYDYIILDEYSMVPTYYLSKLFYIKQDLGSKIVLVGDLNQTLPIDLFERDYSAARCLMEMTDMNHITLTKIQRYDQKLFDVAEKLLKTGVVELEKTNTIDRKSMHLAFTNKKCDEINALLYDKDAVWVPMMCMTNTANYSNSQMVWCDRKNNIYYDYHSRGELPKPVDEKFKLAYCITVHKSQGQTFDKPIVIHEGLKFNKNLMYTAITRVKSYDQVKIFGEVKFYSEHKFSDKCVEINSFVKLGAVYKLMKNEKVVYVGIVHDAKRVEGRVFEHKNEFEFDAFTSSDVKYITDEELLEVESNEIRAELKKGSALFNKQKIGDVISNEQKRLDLIEMLKFKPLEPYGDALIGCICKKKDAYEFRVDGKTIKKIYITAKRTSEQAHQMILEAQRNYTKS